MFNFLVKEIKSKTGELHFRRWSILQTPWFNIYIHKIYKADEDLDCHTYPWNFKSLILKGGYLEKTCFPDLVVYTRYYAGQLVSHKATDAHKLVQVVVPTTTLVFTGSRVNPNWGYETDKGFVDFRTYRENKNKE